MVAYCQKRGHGLGRGATFADDVVNSGGRVESLDERRVEIRIRVVDDVQLGRLALGTREFVIKGMVEC